jgi:hypothetical protein
LIFLFLRHYAKAEYLKVLRGFAAGVTGELMVATDARVILCANASGVHKEIRPGLEIGWPEASASGRFFHCRHLKRLTDGTLPNAADAKNGHLLGVMNLLRGEVSCPFAVAQFDNRASKDDIGRPFLGLHAWLHTVACVDDATN